jgi:hypothetical protein
VLSYPLPQLEVGNPSEAPMGIGQVKACLHNIGAAEESDIAVVIRPIIIVKICLVTAFIPIAFLQ